VSIEHAPETHNHADHVSGHGRLAAATGARVHIHRAAAPDYEHERVPKWGRLGLPLEAEKPVRSRQ
jgi:glyoxylase-like metal-dependent hydrolase (beta-lactamase superfamily II)